MNAVPLADFEPGSPAWQTKITASKVAAILGLSPWESRFSLYHRMAGLIDPQVQTDEMSRGHYLEPAVAAWFADQHPEFDVEPGGAWAHASREWQAASPDRLLFGGEEPETHLSDDPDDPEVFCSRCLAGVTSSEHHEKCIDSPDSLLEIKSETYAHAGEWGPTGTDEIPPYVRCQVVWQMDVMGLPVAHVAAILPSLEFREYRIDYNADEAAYIRAEAKAFLDSLPGGPAEQRPDLDAHSATYVAVQQLHPDITGGDFPVPDDIGREFCAAVRELKAAEAREQTARTVLADAMGDAKRALWLGKTIADRRAKTTGTPYMQAASVKRLPIETPEGIAS